MTNLKIMCINRFQDVIFVCRDESHYNPDIGPDHVQPRGSLSTGYGGTHISSFTASLTSRQGTDDIYYECIDFL